MNSNKHETYGEKANDSRRVLRVERELREVISAYIVQHFRHQVTSFISVPRVVVTKDLRNARVFISVMGGSEEDQQDILSRLNADIRRAQDEVNRHLRMRYCPKMSYELDTSLEKQLRVEGILRRLEEERQQRTDINTGSVE